MSLHTVKTEMLSIDELFKSLYPYYDRVAQARAADLGTEDLDIDLRIITGSSGSFYAELMDTYEYEPFLDVFSDTLRNTLAQMEVAMKRYLEDHGL